MLPNELLWLTEGVTAVCLTQNELPTRRSANQLGVRYDFADFSLMMDSHSVYLIGEPPDPIWRKVAEQTCEVLGRQLVVLPEASVWPYLSKTVH